MAEAVVTGTTPGAFSGLSRLAPWRQVALLAGLAAAVALGVTVAMWSQRPGYALLYGSLGGKDSAAVATALRNAGIPMRVDQGNGAILVPADDVYDARMKLAAQGLPRSTDHGFEILDKQQSFGVSEFVERARYQHALEVELERTISDLDAVQSARVHLAIPRHSSFLRNRERPSASVLVQLYPGRQLEQGQANAIAHLVAAAIPDLEAARVRVVDQEGQLLTAPSKPGDGGADSQDLDYQRRVEQAYITRVQNILAPVVGADGVRAEVTADIDFSRVEQARETYNPDQPALRSERITKERNGAQSTAGGVPGALSNQPPAATSVPQQVKGGSGATGKSGSQSQGGGSSSSSETRNYELDRVVSHVSNPGASLRRLSVAVVVDNVHTVGANGKLISRPRTPEEIARITALVKEAVGYNADRGDTVNVVNAPFTTPAPVEPEPPLPLWKRAWVWTLARQVGGVMAVLFIVFGLLRPIMRNLVARDAAEREQRLALEGAGASGTGADDDEVGEDRVTLSPHRPAGQALPHHGADTVRGMVAQDPKRVANVVRDWVTQDG